MLHQPGTHKMTMTEKMIGDNCLDENDNCRSAISLFSTLPISVAAPGLEGDHMLLDMVGLTDRIDNMLYMMRFLQFARYGGILTTCY